MTLVAELLLARGSRLNSAPRALEPIVLPELDVISEPDFLMCAEHLSAEGVGYVIAYTDEASQLSVRRISAIRRYVRECCEIAIADEIAADEVDRLMNWTIKQAPDYSLFAECVNRVWDLRAKKWHQDLMLQCIRQLVDADGVLATEEVEFFLELQALSET